MKSSYPHPGIRIDYIPVAEGGGLIFVVGMTAIVLLAVPVLRPLVLFSLVAGAALAPILRLRGH